MTENNLEFATVLQEELDRQAMESATTGWMEANSGQVQYNGGNEIKVPKLDMDGLGDYDRVAGFKAGGVSLKFETREMTQDRGRTFSLDSMDVNETNFLATSSNVMGEFQRTKVIPEIDAYRYSKLDAYASENERLTDGYTPTESGIIRQLTNDAYQIIKEVGTGGELIVSMAASAYQVLINNDKIQKGMEVGGFTANEINFEFQRLNGLLIKAVPDYRMMTEYYFYTGQLDDSTQAKGGFAPTETAQQINWIITARNLPIAVSKQDKIRIFTPDVNQQADAYKLDYRRYHDLWALPNQMNKLWVNRQPVAQSAGGNG